MPYITIKQPPVYYQISFEDMIAGIQDLSKYVMSNVTNTRTFWADRPNDKLLENTDIDGMIEVLKTFNQSKEALFQADRVSLYHMFHIPKSSGGLRRIDTPQPELMNALRELKTLFETYMFALYHTTAFAYVRGRSTIDAYFNDDKLDSIIRADEHDDNYELSFFFVNKTLQHQGVGQYLFKYILNKFDNKKLILYVYKDNDPAIHIYKKYGFKEIWVDYGMGYRPNAPYYIMQKECQNGIVAIAEDVNDLMSLPING